MMAFPISVFVVITRLGQASIPHVFESKKMAESYIKAVSVTDPILKIEGPQEYQIIEDGK